jgi:hypothetical protein
MLKGLLVISSLVFCAGALFAPPPSAQDAAKWSAFVLRSANSLGRSALSVVLSVVPSSGDVARYIRGTRLLPERFDGLGNFLEPSLPAPPEPQPPVATPECRLSELDELFQQEHEQQAPVWISHDDIKCSPGAELPRPWCDQRVQAVLRLLEEDRLRRGESAPPLCGAGQPAARPLRE